MTRRCGKVGLLAAYLTVACSGESTPETTAAKIFVRQALSRELDECIPRPEPTERALPFGALDVVFADTYEAMLLFGNQLRTAQDADRNRVTLNSAHVQLRDESGAVLKSFSRSATGFADPGLAEPGWGVTAVTLVPAGIVKPGSTRALTASIRLEGKTLAGHVVETPSFEYTIKVCDGCLIDYPLDADDPSTPAYDCVSGTDAPSSQSCVMGQDDRIDCRLCAATNQRCVSPTSG